MHNVWLSAPSILHLVCYNKYQYYISTWMGHSSFREPLEYRSYHATLSLTVFLSPMCSPSSKHWAWIRITSLLHLLTSLLHTGVKVFFKNLEKHTALYHLIARESFSHWILQSLKACFIMWYAGLVKDQLRDGVQLENIKLDLRIAVLKPLHANWLIALISSDVIIEGFVKPQLRIL